MTKDLLMFGFFFQKQTKSPVLQFEEALKIGFELQMIISVILNIFVCF